MQRLFEIGIHHQFAVISAELFRHGASIFCFVESFCPKSDGESPDGLGACSRHKGDNNGRIDASAQQRSKWHITDQPNANRLCQLLLQFIETLLLGNRWSRSVCREIPVPTEL